MIKQKKKIIYISLIFLALFMILSAVFSFKPAKVRADTVDIDNHIVVTENRPSLNNQIDISVESVMSKLNSVDSYQFDSTINHGFVSSDMLVQPPMMMTNLGFYRGFNSRNSEIGERFYEFILFTVDEGNIAPVHYLGYDCFDHVQQNFNIFNNSDYAYEINLYEKTYSSAGKIYLTSTTDLVPAVNPFNYNGLITNTNIFVKTDSYYTKYQLVVKYTERLYSSTDIWGKFSYDDERQSIVYSKVFDIASILDEYRNDPNSTFSGLGEETQTKINNIIDNKVSESITVQYLTEIEGTPFAKPVQSQVQVTKQEGVYYVPQGEILKQLDLDNVNVFNSHIDSTKGFVYDEVDQIYKADYLKTIKMQALTVDGNSYDYFLDINKSFEDAFLPLVNAGAVSNVVVEDIAVDFYDWAYNELLVRYPVLEGMARDEIYGYYGYVVIPQTYTINTALKFLFDVDTKEVGVVWEYHSNTKLTNFQYNNLLKVYGYSAFSRLWNQIPGFLDGLVSTEESTYDATHYLLYADPTSTNGGIFDQGDETGGSIAGNGVKNIIGAVRDFFSTSSNIAFAVFGVVVIIVVVGKINKKNKENKKK